MRNFLLCHTAYMASGYGVDFNATRIMFRLRPQTIKAVITRGLNKASMELEGAVKDSITPFTRTGRLRSSITHRIVSDDTARIFSDRTQFGSNVYYAPMVEYGTKPHIIRPRTKKALAWPTSGQSAAGLGRGWQGTIKGKAKGSTFADFRAAGGTWRGPYKQVNHPGTKGKGFMRKTLLRVKPRLIRIFQHELGVALGEET